MENHLPYMEIRSQTPQLILETRSGVGWNQNLAIYLKKKILIKLGMSNSLGQSASWRTLFGGFSPLARGLNWLVVPRPKDQFLWFFKGEFLQRNDYPCQGGCHESGFRLFHCSQVTEKALQCERQGDCRDSDKLLCNTRAGGVAA